VPITAREAPVDAVLSVGSGFGGFQSAVVMTGPEGARR
jgi:act minimal PKS ketosynthase (KS/KS alpha)